MTQLRQTIKWAVFFLLFWLSIMLVNIWAHELGHAIVASIGGWQHNLVYFGVTGIMDNEMMHAVANWYAQPGAPSAAAERTAEETANLIMHLGTSLPLVRYGVLGGWLGQFTLTLIFLLLSRTKAFREGASAFGRIFIIGFIIINTAWMGGNWLLLGIKPVSSSDPVILLNLFLGGNRLLIALLWLVAAAIIGLSVWLARRLGAAMFVPFGFSAEKGQQLATAIALTTGLASPILRLTNTTIGVPLILIGVTLVPTWLVLRGNASTTLTIPRIVWQNTLIALSILFALIFSNSGLFINGDSMNDQQTQVILAEQCLQTRCLSEELEVWYPDAE